MKKNTFPSFILFVCIVLSSSSSFSQGFNSISTPDGVNVIAVGNSGKLYRSTNSGNTWASYTSLTDNLKSVFSLNDNVWISSDNGKIFKTLKTNSSIDVVNIGVTSTINSVIFVNDNVGFLCGDGGVLYKSIDGGTSWTLSNSGIGTVKLNSISFSDLQNGVTVGESGKVFLTVNGGATWTQENVNTTQNLLKVKFFNDGISLVGEYGVLMLKPNGSAWTAVNTRISTDITGVSGMSMNDIHVCGGGGFIRNNNSGNVKFTNFEVNPMMLNLVDIFYYNANTAFAVSSLTPAIIKTSDAGVSWNLTAGTTRTLTWVSKLSASGGIGNNLCMHPNDRNAMFVVYGSTVWRSGNRGDTWTNIASVTGGGSAHSFYVSPLDTNIWMIAITGSPDKVKRTTNYGVTWTDILSLNFSNYGQPLEMDQNNPNNYYFAPDGGGFYRSTNNGASFTEISTNYPFRSPCDIIVMWDSSDVIFVGDGVTGSGQAKIFKSINGGKNWTDMYTVASSETPSLCNSVFDQSLAYSTEWGGSGFYKSTNFGNNWTLSGSTGTSGWGSDVCHEDPTLVLKGTYGSPTYTTTNSGSSFTSTTLGGGCGAGIMVPERGLLISMQCSGLFKMNVTYSVLTDINVNSVNSLIPEKFNLAQNYPNPFNPTTNIKFDIPQSGNVSLKVYDQLGAEMNSLVDGFKNSGSYEVNFNASELPSGVYFYKLTTAGNSLTKKMLLVK